MSPAKPTKPSRVPRPGVLALKALSAEWVCRELEKSRKAGHPVRVVGKGRRVSLASLLRPPSER